MAKKAKQPTETSTPVTKGVTKAGPREQLASLIAARSGRGYFVALDASRAIPDEEIPKLLTACSSANGAEAICVFDAAISAKLKPADEAPAEQ